ncbi:DMT family transporter [Moraxella catarrhalis]|uniref:Integral membrane protein n=1 Tax=Moraxella catarrhalis TaxID=480 RepID=A0A198UPS1_MORCA|nr:DMT family transporter [Moraxella catarrhalis]OAU98341.1 Integral membrane protein [Moraxella catarrhalis]OAU98593.1 Integral membrane protein [Moraxella catarrhalis]OAV02847.1 Integral membrane protein [Moraxella catarrhalis]
MKLLPFILISILGGLIIPLQIAIVNSFRQSTQATQIQATFYLYLGGTIASLLLSFVISGGIKPPNMQNAQWWQYLTGFLGSFYILFMFIAAPKIGSANTLLWVFLGQMLFATVLAHFGFLGLEIRKIEPVKLFGLGLIIIGGGVLIWAEK